MKMKKQTIALIIIAILLVLAAIITAFVIFGVPKIQELFNQNLPEEVSDEPVDVFAGDYFDDRGYFKDVNPSDYAQIPDYKSIVIPEELKTISDEDFNTEIAAILSQFPVTTEVTDPNYLIQDGDTLNIDFLGTVDGVAFEGGSTDGYGSEVTIGTTQFIDGFLDQLIGHKVGENFDINVTFPDPYTNSPDLSGKDAVFNITINNIYQTSVPTELTDEIVSTNFSAFFSTADEMLTTVRQDLITYQIEDYILDTLLEQTTINSIPDSMTQYGIDTIKDYIYTDSATYGMTQEEYLSLMGFSSLDEYIEYEKPTLEETNKRTLMYELIADAEGLSITTELIDTFFLDNYGSSDWSGYKEVYGENYIKSIVLEDLVLSHVSALVANN